MDIVEELRQNRESGARRLETEYKAGLMTLARRFCQDSGDAEELVNRTFAAVVEGIDDYLEQSAFFAWMCQILTNIHSMDVRRKSNQNIIYPGIVPDTPDEEANEEIYRNLDHSLLRDAIQSLPKEMKEVIVMHYLMEEPVPQVAKFLCQPVTTVKWRLHCARKALAAKMGVKMHEMAEKPGGKAVILALLLCGLTALGAGIGLAVAHLLPSPSVAVEQQADNSKDAGQAETGTLSFSTSSNLPQSPSAATPSATDCYRPPATENSSLTTQGENMNKTTTTRAAAMLAAATFATSAVIPNTANAYDWSGYATLKETWNNHSPAYSSFVATSDWNWPGSVPSTFDDAAAASAHYGVKSGYSCFVNPTSRNTLPGSLIAIEGWLYANSDEPYNLKMAHLLPGGGFRIAGGNACFSGDIVVYGTADNPSRAYIQAATTSESQGFEFRNMTLAGSADSVLRLYGVSSCVLGAFKWTGSGAGFLGMILVDAEGMASNGKAKLMLGDMEIGGTVKIRNRSFLTLAGSTGVTVSNAIFEAGATLAGASGARKLTVAGSFTAAAPVTIDMASYTPPANGSADIVTIISFPAGAEVSELDTTVFVLANGVSDRVTYGGTVFVRDDPGGGKSLCVSIPSASLFVTRNRGVASTPDYPGYSEFDWAEDSSGNAFWSDGELPDAANAAGKAYFSAGAALVPPVSGNEIGVFHGESLTLKNTMLNSGASSAGFNVPDLRFDGNCGLRFWSSAGVWSAAFRDENGSQLRAFRLQGTIDTGNGAHWFEQYNEKHMLCVESELTGAGNITMRTYPSQTAANCEAFFELAAFNTNWFGKIEVAGFGANYTANGGYKDYSGATLPNRTKRCRLFVADSRNLGGALSAFAYDALSLHHYGELFCRNDVTLEDGLNRGVSFGDFSTLFVTNGLTLAILRPATWNGCVFKTGGGTLALGGSLSFGGAAQSATPSENCNILAMEGGWLAPRTATAFDGLRMEFSNGSGISLTLRPEDASVAQYGLYDVKEETPFAIIGGGTIPVAIDFSHENAPQRQHFSVAVATVRDDYAGVLKDILDFAPGSVPRAFNGEFRIRENGDGTSTVFASLSPAATFVVFR